jgi:hypothetical protein
VQVREEYFLGEGKGAAQYAAGFLQPCRQLGVELLYQIEVENHDIAGLILVKNIVKMLFFGRAKVAVFEGILVKT